jgi:hypothetical protein
MDDIVRIIYHDGFEAFNGFVAHGISEGALDF